jgi:hypothetical protein
VAISPKEKTTLHKKFARQKTMQTDGLGLRLSPYRYLHTTQNQIKMGEWDSILRSIHSHHSKKEEDILFEKLES